MVGELAFPYQEKRKDRKFSDFHTAEIEAWSGFHQGVILRGAASSKLEWFVNSNSEDFREFRHRIKTEYEKWLNVVKETAFRAGAPLRAELLNMVYESDEALGQEAERESLGFNSSRLHTDIYMDELLRA